MKRILTLVIFSLLITLFPIASFALDVSIGISSWYATWEMEEQEGTMDLGEALLLGPVLAIKFAQNWSISSVFLYGKFNVDFGDEEGDSFDIKRYDSDTALNFFLNRYIKLFAGFKYMGYEFSGGEHIGMGPGLGIGITLPLFSNLYLLGNFSGMYIKGTHKEESNDDGSSSEEDYTESGFNAAVSLAYYIDSMSTSINLGFRYQQFTSKEDDPDSSDTKFTFYGATLAAVYSFDI